MKGMSSEYIYTNDTSVVQLDAEKAFKALTDGEQLYAQYLSKSSWFGSLIVLFQTSPESPLIFTFFRRIFNGQPIEELKQLAKNVADFDDKDWQSLLVYYSAFLANMGNYRFFGNSKFVPDLPQHKLEALVVKTRAYEQNELEMNFIWHNIKHRLYSLSDTNTTYFSKNFTEEDYKLVKQFMELNKIEAYNSRVFKCSQTNTFEIRFASVLTSDEPQDSDYLKVSSTELNGHKFVLSRGHYSPILQILNKYLIEAKTNALNESEDKMIGQYIKHFQSGDLNAHKDGSRYWVKDKGPIVESYLGFIETSRGPAGMRAEFMGFVSMVNKEVSKRFSSLVSNAASLLPLLPWGKSFEKDRFLKPDFTALDVLTFSGSGIPWGYMLPNYQDICKDEGCKNISFRNVILASLKDWDYHLLSEEDSKLMEKHLVNSFEVQVGLHELLGHGSGKLLQIKDQKPNFDIENTINPLTNRKVDNWYTEGQSYESVFTYLGPSYEECRAECVGLYLCLDPNVMKIFGFSGSEAEDVVYVNWLSMIQTGVQSLRMYNPRVNKWLQAHSQARYVITRLLLESAKQLVSIKYIEKNESDGKPDLLISLTRDHQLIQTVGRKAIGDFLLRLQVYKSLGDIQSAQQMYDKYSEVSDALEHPYLTYRQIVLDRKKPQKLFVQSSTHLSAEGKVELKSYGSTPEGLIQSFADHISSEPEVDSILIDLWKKDSKYFVGN